MATEMLLCSDLDRTLLPNGPQHESPQARNLLRGLAERPEVTLVYVSGRHEQLLLDAIDEFEIPVPDYAIGDVGTTIYQIDDGRWIPWDEWSKEIATDWNGREHDELAALFEDMHGLQLQEDEKQNTYKLSYYAAEDEDSKRLTDIMRQRLQELDVRASLIWSVDEALHRGLLDVLPACATKYHAIRFLMKRKGFSDQHTVFAGDSGNDLPVLTSGMQAVLVRNAIDAVRREAVRAVRAKGCEHRLYLARGGFLGMNGNYSAGVLEGVAHFLPQVEAWLSAM
jgi:HAD superfamily hydrolase (TIGR01484 family)